jgi:asparagine synthase (glutamine-hydrolysing)
VFRYVALMWNALSPEIAATADELARRLGTKSPQWSDALVRMGLRVLVADRSRHFGAHVILDGAAAGPVTADVCDDGHGAGVVLGEIFRRCSDIDQGAGLNHAVFSLRDSRAIIDTQGRSLATDYWGNFVALLVENARQARFVFNDPCGTLPCHFVEHRGVQVVFSCLGDCLDMGLKFAVNWEFVRARAVNGFLDFDIPSYIGVASVHRGECVRFDVAGRCLSRSVYWHPARFDRASDLIVEPALAAKALRATVRSCVHSMVGHHSSVLSQTSGGLDSSIVLGCLGDAPNKPEISCYTDYVPNAVCDERRWARYAVQRKGFRHIEVPSEPGAVVYEDLPALAPSMEPATYLSHALRGPLERKLASEHGATAVFTGEGGDSTFCSTSFVFAVNHSFRRYGLRRRTLRTAAMVAARRDRTVWKVLAKAVWGEIFGIGTRGYRGQLSTVCRLASSDVRQALKTDPRVGNYWLSANGPVTQESLLRLGTLAFAPVFYDLSTSHHHQAPYTASPLCAQPVFEMGMRIPVDVHFYDGRSRGLARRAFVRDVPAPILRRQWKDRPLSQVGAVIQRNLTFIRETLLEGSLMREGILDRAAVELALQDAPTTSAALSGEILSHVDLELWSRNSA